MLDGLGPVGGDDHSRSEWLDLTSVVLRVTLLAGLLLELAETGEPHSATQSTSGAMR